MKTATKKGAGGWTCPTCHRRFAHANQWHSCAVQDLDAHFGRAGPRLKRIFARLLSTCRRNGPVTVVPQKSKIALYARVTFGGVNVKSDALLLGIILGRRLDHPRVIRHASYGPHTHALHLLLHTERDIDAELATWLAEAYQRARGGARTPAPACSPARTARRGSATPKRRK